MALGGISGLLIKKPIFKKIHIISGIAMIGFSIWHHSLYNTDKTKAPYNAK